MLGHQNAFLLHRKKPGGLSEQVIRFNWLFVSSEFGLNIDWTWVLSPLVIPNLVATSKASPSTKKVRNLQNLEKYMSHVTCQQLTNQVLDMVRSHGRNFKTSLSTWKMLLRQFPDITADTAKHMFLDVVCASPCHIEYSIHTLGLTAQDLPPWDRLRHQTPKSTQTWLAMHRR
ncbi:hypothetical protein Pelo_938 [Pelomyxa schiedti]|nr:hypothetical protein Pelo_938 [Pelomyxa schiedti]